MHSLISEIRAAKHPSCKQLICSGAPARRGLGSGALYLRKFAKASISKPSDVTWLSSDGFFFTFLLDIFYRVLESSIYIACVISIVC